MQNHIYPVSYKISSIETSQDTLVMHLIPHLPHSKQQRITEELCGRLLLNKGDEEAVSISSNQEMVRGEDVKQMHRNLSMYLENDLKLTFLDSNFCMNLHPLTEACSERKGSWPGHWRWCGTFTVKIVFHSDLKHSPRLLK